MTKTLLLILALSFSACSLKNPFQPPDSTQRGLNQTTQTAQSPEHSEAPIRSEAMYRATMKPYERIGVRYTPTIPKVGDTFTGIASWYGTDFHGKQTSNGEYYDMNSATAAHKTLPMNTKLLVTNLDNGASTVVRINDRGPFVAGRIIDLSNLAASEVGMVDKGIANIKIEVLAIDPTVITCQNTPDTPSTLDTNNLHQKINQQRAKQKTTTNPLQNTNLHYRVQILSTANLESAQKFAQNYATIDDRYTIRIKTKTFWKKTNYKVSIGDFSNVDEAQKFIADNALSGAFVIKE